MSPDRWSSPGCSRPAKRTMWSNRSPATCRGGCIHVNEHTPFYAHVICDLSPALRQQIENYDFTPTPDGAGYFNLNSQLRVWIEVLSFDKLIDDAKRRNAVFFEKLGVQTIGN